MEEQVLSWIGGLITYGGGLIGIAYVFFRFLGTKWIDTKFHEKLEAFKHTQNKDLEELRFKINSMFNRVSKVHDKEFEVIPEIWGKLNDTFFDLARVASSFQSYPDLKKMSASHLEEFVDKIDFRTDEKEELLKSNDMNKYYQDHIFFYDMKKVRDKYSDFHIFLRKNGIFLREELKNKFVKIDDLMWNVILMREIGNEINDAAQWSKASREMNEIVKPIMDEIENLIHKGIHSRAIE